MLTFTLFGAVFSSIVWLVYALRFVFSSLTGISFFEAGILNVLLYVVFVCFPLFIIWAIYGFICQQIYNRTTSRQMFRLFSQMKKNQEYSDLLARIMLETEQNIKDSFVLSRFDLLIADMNELLSEFLHKERLISQEQAEHLWIKVQNGGKWSFGKVLIENYNRQPNFQKKVFADSSSDNVLSGTIMEFCARYQTLISLLEKHDKEKIFVNVIEAGVLGKVYTVLAPIADEIRRSRESFSSFDNIDEEQTIIRPTENIKSINTHQESNIDKKGFFDKFISSKKDVIKHDEPVKDAFSLALERSFKEEIVKEEPIFDDKIAENSSSVNFDIDEKSVLDTQITLNNLKKEWQNLDPKLSDSTDEDLTYPFGGWTDADKYQK